MSETESGFGFSVLPVTPFEQNATLVWCTSTMRGAIIDPGGELGRLREFVEQTGVTLEKILLTHGHVDHAGGASELREQLSIPVIGPHMADAFWLDRVEEAGRMYGLHGVHNVKPDHWLGDGDKVEFGEAALEVIHAPGHTPGHVVFYNPPARWAQVGDVLFHGSVGRTDFPLSNHDDLIDAIINKLLPLGDDIEFVAGHGPMGNFGDERRNNPFLNS